MADPWDWQDDGFKLDAESPLEITRCLWNELPHSVEDSRSLFSTPLADIAAQDPSFYPIRGQDAELFASRFCNSGLQAGGGSSPRMKRRRLLFCEPDPVFNDCDPHAESDGVIDSFTNCIDPLMQGCSSGLQQSMDINPLPPDFWYRHCDDMAAPFGGAVEAESHNWMTKPLEDGPEIHGSDENNMKITLPGWSGCGGQPVPLSEEDVIQGPATPLPGRPTLYNNSNHNHSNTLVGESETRNSNQHQLSPPTIPYPKFSTPVAYPFTLLKPSETEGDITLKDINQRILMPPSRPIPHLQQQHQQQAMDDSSSWPSSGGSGCCSPTDPGLLLGLSGKSIVTRTKIHTEGNGTITIMRTRG